MKRAMAVLLTGVMTLGLAACGGGNDSEGGAAETYKVSYNMNTGNIESMPDYQFQGGDITGFIGYEGRIYDDITLTLNSDGTYELTSDVYTMENGERIEIGSSDGIGLVCILNAEGTYEDNGDGTVTTSAADHATFDLESDVYSKEIVAAAGLAPAAGEEAGEYDSDDTPVLLDWVPETVFTLSEEGDIVTYERADGAAGTEAAGEAGEAAESTDTAGTQAE